MRQIVVKWMVHAMAYMVIMGPADQEDDLVSAAVAHAIAEHGHADSAELRKGLPGMIRPVTV